MFERLPAALHLLAGLSIEAKRRWKRRRMFLQRENWKQPTCMKNLSVHLGLNAVHKLFSESEVEELIGLINRFAA
jgi:hypothetical protein